MSIKYEHLLCVSDALGAPTCPSSCFRVLSLSAPSFPPWFFAALSSNLFENQLTNPTDKQPLGHGILFRKYSQFLAKAQHKQLCATELMFAWNDEGDNSGLVLTPFKVLFTVNLHFCCDCLMYRVVPEPLFCSVLATLLPSRSDPMKKKLSNINRQKAPSYLTDQRWRPQFRG